MKNNTDLMSALFGPSTGAHIFYIVVIILVLFIVVRYVLLWYWKIDRTITLLEKIEENTRPKNEEQSNID